MKTVKIKSRRGLPLHYQGQEFPADENGVVEIPERIAKAKGIMPKDAQPSAEKQELVSRAVELGIGAPSQLSRWGEDRLRSEIEAAEANVEGENAEE